MSGFFNANKLVKRIDRLELLTMSNSGPAPTPIIPTLQEVTAQANTSDHSIIITGMNGYLPPEDGLVIANAPNFQSAIVYFTDNKDKGSLSFSDAQTSLTFKTDSRGDFRVAISESGVSVQGLLSTGSTIADITEGTEKAVTTKEWVLDKLDGFISSGDNISELNNDVGYITETSNFVTLDGDQTISGMKTFTDFWTIFDNSNILLQNANLRFESNNPSLHTGSIGYSGNSVFRFVNSLTNNNFTINFSGLSASRNYALPDKSGTIALLDDIPSPASGFSGSFETATDTITVVNGLITAVTPL